MCKKVLSIPLCTLIDTHHWLASLWVTGERVCCPPHPENTESLSSWSQVAVTSQNNWDLNSWSPYDRVMLLLLCHSGRGNSFWHRISQLFMTSCYRYFVTTLFHKYINDILVHVPLKTGEYSIRKKIHYMDKRIGTHILITEFMCFIQTHCHRCIKSST